jgi:hypothetical protein
MDANGQHGAASADGATLRWTGRVLSAQDLRGSLNGQRELVLSSRTIVTPSAAEELRANGVHITREPAAAAPAARTPWGFAQERPQTLVRSAVQSLARDGLVLRELAPVRETAPCVWARAVAECVARGECRGGLVFCEDPGLICCVANKLTGLRAVAVCTGSQAARAARTLGANLVAIEMPGRTFFEVRQIVRTLCAAGEPVCPSGVDCTLKELESHAHR